MPPPKASAVDVLGSRLFMIANDNTTYYLITYSFTDGSSTMAPLGKLPRGYYWYLQVCSPRLGWCNC